MADTCADLWVFSHQDTLYAVHGCADIGDGAFCFNSAYQQISCPQAILEPNNLPGCQPDSFSYDDIGVHGCISALNLQLSQSEPLDINAAQQILNRTSTNFPKCPMQGSLIPCPVQLEQAQLIPGSVANLNSTSNSALNNETSLATSILQIVTQNTNVPSSATFSSSDDTKLTVNQVDNGAAPSSLSTGTIVGIGIASAAAVTLIFISIYLFCLRRRTKKARRFEDFDDDDHDLYSKWTKSMYKSGGGERSAFITNAVPVASPPTNYAETVIEPSVFEGKRYTALHPYTQSHSDEIDVEVGDILQVNKYFNDAWCSGTNVTTGKSGMFPFALVTTED